MQDDLCQTKITRANFNKHIVRPQPIQLWVESKNNGILAMAVSHTRPIVASIKLFVYGAGRHNGHCEFLLTHPAQIGLRLSAKTLAA